MNLPAQPMLTQKEMTKTWLTPKTALLGGLIFALMVYWILPMVGISTFAEKLTVKKFILLVCGLFAMAGYGVYLQTILNRPQLLAMFVLWFWPLLEFIDQWLLVTVGVNLHLRPVLIMTITLPAGLLFYQNFKAIWYGLPYVKYLLFFTVWFVGYFLFFNNHMADPMQISGTLLDTMDFAFVIAYLNTFVCIVVAAVCYIRSPEPERMLDKLNIGLLIVSTLVAVISILGYPLNIWTLKVDGFTRSIGIFSQPNPFAHHLAILLLYFMGLLGYYTHQKESRVPKALIVAAIICNIAALGLAMSKTAIAIFAGCAALWLVINMPSAAVRKNCIKWAPIAAILLGLAIVVLQVVLDRSFFELFESRVNDTDSLNWRQQVWQGLWNNMDLTSWLFGRGLTSSNEWVFQLTYNNRLNSKPLIMVHNGYINLLYDLGMMGWMLFVGVVSMLWQSISRLWLKPDESSRFLIAAIIVMGVYFLAVSAMDEMTYMFDAAMLFWMLSTFLFCKVFIGSNKQETGAA